MPGFILAVLTYVVGFVAFFICMTATMGIGFGITALLQKAGLKNHVMGDEWHQIILCFSMALNAILIGLIVGYSYRRWLTRLIRKDCHFMVICWRTLVRGFRRSVT